MAIRFEYGPPQSALGALAYQAGAAEAADRRRREIEQMQMQAAQMRQKQQQAAMDRQFSAWRTQYDHFSGLDKMQKEHEWRDGFQEKGHENAKELYDFSSAEKQRAADVAHIRSLERQREASEQIGDRARFADIRTEQNGRIEQLRRALNQAGDGAAAKAKAQYDKAIGKPNLSPDHRRQARAQYISSLEQIVSNPDNTRPPREWQDGWRGKTSSYGVREVRKDGKTFWEYDPGFDPQKRKIDGPKGFDDKGNEIQYFDYAEIKDGQVTIQQDSRIIRAAPAPKIDYKTAAEALFKEEDELVWDGTAKEWEKTGRKVIRLTPNGWAALHRSPIDDFGVDWPESRNDLLEFYINEQNPPAGAGAPAAKGAPAAPGPPAAMVPGSPGSAEEYAAAEAGAFPIGHPGRPGTAAERVGGAAAHGIGRMAGAAAQVPGMMARQAGAAIRGAIEPQGVRQFKDFVDGVERELQEADKINPKMRELLGRARNIQDLPQDQLDVLAEEIAKEKALLERFGMGLGDLEDGFKNQLNPQR